MGNTRSPDPRKRETLNFEVLSKFYYYHICYIYIYIYIYISLCHTITTDISDPLSPHLPIVHYFRQILRATSYIGTELLYVGSNWTSLPLLVHVKGCTGVHPSRARPYFSGCVLRLVRLILRVFVMGGRWPYSCCFVWCCLQDLFNIARSILV